MTSKTSDGASVLEELFRRRSSVKGQVTKFRNYLVAQIQKGQLTSTELTELQLKLQKIEALSIRFDNLQEEIEVLNHTNLKSELEERESIEHEFIQNIAAAKNLTDKYLKAENEQRRDSIQVSQCSHDHKEIGIKLPQINIAKFDGAYFRWLEFHDTFKTLIHDNIKISPIQKYHYLVSYLEGDAGRIISNLEVSSDTYEEAWKLICDRYNNKRLLTNHHLNALFSIERAANETEKSLRFLVDTVTKNLRALRSLGQPTDKWDTLIIFMISSKLDSQTLAKWEEYRNTITEQPTISDFFKLLTDRADVLESLNRNKSINSNNKNTSETSRGSEQNNQNKNNKGNQNYNNRNNSHANKYKQEKSNQTKSFATVHDENQKSSYLCVICGKDHRIYDCAVFKDKNLKERLEDVKLYKLCSNCLRQGHPERTCRVGPCRICNKKHNSLLHNTEQPVVNHASAECSQDETTVNFTKQNCNEVLLSTALIELVNPKTKETQKVRALLDCGSQSTFITKKLQQKLSLDSCPIGALKVIGIGNNCSDRVVEKSDVQLKSLHTPFSVLLSCFVLNELTSNLPRSPINVDRLKIPDNIQLADPTFHTPASIDMLIGADIFWDVLGNEEKSLGPRTPKLRSSKLGWLLSGPINSQRFCTFSQVQCNHAAMMTNNNNNLSDEIDKSLQKFWQIEELPNKQVFSESDEACEKHFSQNTIRLDDGRFCVKLPLTTSPDCLGDTYGLAKRRLFNLEKRFRRNHDLKIEYAKFIEEYGILGHLSESAIVKPIPSYFFCHHAVLKQDSESTKLRVVFSGSEQSSSGCSLNNILMVGPNVQDSLFNILIRARQYKYLLTGDIEKMYRQVQVAESDRDLQLIVWRETETEPIKTLRLNTLTYGTASASYLSTRCLKQLGEEHDDSLIKTIIKQDFYVDDLITGADNERQLKYIQKEVTKTLKTGCFNLRKFKSNLNNLFTNSNLDTQQNLTISESSSTLGLGWCPASDTLNFPIKNITQPDLITKRVIMSTSFKIFDPLGLLSPSIIQPKMLLQKLWKHKLDWDQPVPLELKKEWERFAENMSFLKDLQIPRRVLCEFPKTIEMHVFSDASLNAYGACIYLRSTDVNGHITTRLLTAKSKVCPLLPSTVPRLELAAGLLAARLSRSVIDSLRNVPTRVVHWCDSSIVLAWINSDVGKLKAFVANRISEIKELTDKSSWRYVPTAANPADLISRGVDASQLLSMQLWWTGPSFLTKDESEWPVLNTKIVDKLPEIKSNTVTIKENIIKFENYSKLIKLQRSFAYVKRFIYNLKNKNNKITGILTVDELNESFHSLCIMAQRELFATEYDCLKNNKPLRNKTKILSLSPFLDSKGLIRVGGRISAADYPYDKVHPILLHASHHLTKLIFEKEHLRNMHAGPQLLLAAVREYVWPVNGRYLSRRTVNKCVRCRRLRGKTLVPMMGQLPAQRITVNHPFVSVGIDMAGPFHILNRKGRGSRLIKCYLCLFVCLRYKCIHLEGVSDLTKNSFVMTLRRFIARRGKPAEIFCDNGGNFVAAAKEIGASQEGIQFYFSPSYAPHFGGIWEAGVKSAKHHLRRVVGNSHLTFEELSTLFAQVEAILNSRPLCPLSSSPDDLLPLSPGHFLIGRPLAAMASPALEDRRENTLQRYERIERLRQHFWRRWQKEYIAELQQRTKWKTSTDQLNLDDLVLLQEDNVPPLCWRLGRVSRLFPGPDGVSRVADITTARGCVRRPLTRLCPLPTAEDLNLSS